MKAHELVAQGWNRFNAARRKGGSPCSPNDNRAVTWSILGALISVYGNHLSNSIHPYHKVRTALSGVPLTSWEENPARTQEEVVELLKRLDI